MKIHRFSYFAGFAARERMREVKHEKNSKKWQYATFRHSKHHVWTGAASGAAQPLRTAWARAFEGSASRAEPGEGENRYRRYALKRGFGGRVPRRGAGGGAPANGTCPPPIRPQGRRPFNASLRLSAPYYSAAYPRTRIARRISHKIVGRGVDYDSPADYLRNGEALGVYRAESKSVV